MSAGEKKGKMKVQGERNVKEGIEKGVNCIKNGVKCLKIDLLEL